MHSYMYRNSGSNRYQWHVIHHRPLTQLSVHIVHNFALPGEYVARLLLTIAEGRPLKTYTMLK